MKGAVCGFDVFSMKTMAEVKIRKENSFFTFKTSSENTGESLACWSVCCHTDGRKQKSQTEVPNQYFAETRETAISNHQGLRVSWLSDSQAVPLQFGLITSTHIPSQSFNTGLRINSHTYYMQAIRHTEENENCESSSRERENSC